MMLWKLSALATSALPLFFTCLSASRVWARPTLADKSNPPCPSAASGRACLWGHGDLARPSNGSLFISQRCTLEIIDDCIEGTLYASSSARNKAAATATAGGCHSVVTLFLWWINCLNPPQLAKGLYPHKILEFAKQVMLTPASSVKCVPCACLEARHGSWDTTMEAFVHGLPCIQAQPSTGLPPCPGTVNCHNFPRVLCFLMRLSHSDRQSAIGLWLTHPSWQAWQVEVEGVLWCIPEAEPPSRLSWYATRWNCRHGPVSEARGRLAQALAVQYALRLLLTGRHLLSHYFLDFGLKPPEWLILLEGGGAGSAGPLLPCALPQGHATISLPGHTAWGVRFLNNTAAPRSWVTPQRAQLPGGHGQTGKLEPGFGLLLPASGPWRPQASNPRCILQGQQASNIES